MQFVNKKTGRIVDNFNAMGCPSRCKDCPVHHEVAYSGYLDCMEYAYSSTENLIHAASLLGYEPLDGDAPVDEVKADTEDEPVIKDSGERTEYDTGAVRDCKEGKGRCDLMPLDVLAMFFTQDGHNDTTLDCIANFRNTGEVKQLLRAIDAFNELHWHNNRTMMLEVSKHFEEGAKKYGECNWQRGIPVHSYIDSAVRHYLKWLRGDNDEPHDRAFVWNLLCCAWTMLHHPEMDDYTCKEV